MRRLAFATAVMLVTAGCGPETPDYQSIWTTTTTTTTDAPAEPPVPFSAYLEDSGIGQQRVAPDALTDLTVSMPIPAGWEKYTNPAIPPETEMIAKDGSLPNAMLVVSRLTGDFDAHEVAKHANADAVLAQNFKQLDASSADFHGFPSSMIQGSYDLNGRRLHTFNRVVVATGSPPESQHYLVQLTVTSLADQAVAQAGGIEEIIRGFTVAAK